ncbi:DUF305 domain-containing protein [Microbispora sp. CA-102843]|uniref:DUF305 domain-containing protein n=1 Tax=Microbispora sp. CA-102843 TaxID=3239952 RepID=UPI003D948E89
MPTLRYLSAFALVTGVIAGCTAETPKPPAAPAVVQPGAPGKPVQVLSSDAVPRADNIPITAADVLFMQGMISHHAQALRMTALVPTHSTNRDISLIAGRIAASQEDEITLMRRWLQDRGQTVPDANHDHSGTGDGELMPGMLTEEQFAELRKANGAEFDRLFVKYMIAHHMGALQMVEKLFNSDGGQETEINIYATHVGADQSIEVDRMQKLLAEMGVTSPK